MVRTFESLQCDGKDRFEWARYEALAPDSEQRQLIISKYDLPFSLHPPFEVMVTGASGQEQMTVLAAERLPGKKARLTVSRGPDSKDFRSANDSSR